MRRNNGGCSGIFGLTFLGIVLLVMWMGAQDKRTASSQSNTSYQQASAQTVENHLAEIDAGHSVSDSDPNVAEFRSLLVQLEYKTTTPQEDIANMTIKGQKILHDQYDKNLSLLRLMSAVNKSLPESTPHVMKYDEALSLFIAVYGGQ